MGKYQYSGKDYQQSTGWASNLNLVGYSYSTHYASALTTEISKPGYYNITFSYFPNRWNYTTIKMKWALSNLQPAINSSSSPTPQEMIDKAIMTGETICSYEWKQQSVTISNAPIKTAGTYSIILYTEGSTTGIVQIFANTGSISTPVYVKSIEKVPDSISLNISTVQKSDNRQYVVTPTSSIGSSNISSYTCDYANSAISSIFNIQNYSSSASDALNQEITSLQNKKDSLSDELKSVSIITDSGDTSNLYNLLYSKYYDLIQSLTDEITNYKTNSYLITFKKYGTADFVVKSYLSDTADTESYLPGSTEKTITLAPLSFSNDTALQNKLKAALKVYYSFPSEENCVYTGNQIAALTDNNYDKVIFNDLQVYWKLSTQSDSEYSLSIPKVINVGTYDIDFKITGTFYEDSFTDSLGSITIYKKDANISNVYTMVGSAKTSYTVDTVPAASSSGIYYAEIDDEDSTILSSNNNGITITKSSTGVAQSITYVYSGTTSYNSFSKTYPVHQYLDINDEINDDIISKLDSNIVIVSKDLNNLNLQIPLSVITKKDVVITSTVESDKAYLKDEITSYDIITGEDGSTKYLYFKDYLGLEHLEQFNQSYCTIKDDEGNIRTYQLLSDNTLSPSTISYSITITNGGTLTIPKISLSELTSKTFSKIYSSTFTYAGTDKSSGSYIYNIFKVSATIIPDNKIYKKAFDTYSNLNGYFLIPFTTKEGDSSNTIVVDSIYVPVVPPKYDDFYSLTLNAKNIESGTYYTGALYLNDGEEFNGKINEINSDNFSYPIPKRNGYMMEFNGPYNSNSELAEKARRLQIEYISNYKTESGIQNMVICWANDKINWKYIDENKIEKFVNGNSIGEKEITWSKDSFYGKVDTDKIVVKGNLYSKNSRIIQLGNSKCIYSSEEHIFILSGTKYVILNNLEESWLDNQTVLIAITLDSFIDEMSVKYSFPSEKLSELIVNLNGSDLVHKVQEEGLKVQKEGLIINDDDYGIKGVYDE